jgi:hypothetical protein
MGLQKREIVCKGVDDVWKAFLEANKVDDAEKLLKDGWLTIAMLSEILGLSRCRVADKCRGLESKEAIYNGRRTKFWRPKA